MKKILFAIILVVLSASCQKNLEVAQEATGHGFVSKLKVTATINGTKVSYVEDSETHALQPSWEIGDKIIGFDSKGETYCFKISEINAGRASLELITEGDDAGTAEEDPADGTSMYMFYAPGAVKDSLHADKKMFTVSIKEQAADVIPALMMAQATVEGRAVNLHFTNETSIIAIKTPKMVKPNSTYTNISLFGTGVNTEVKFSVNESGTLESEPAKPGRISKKINATSDANGSIDDVIYMVSAPIGEATKLTFQAENGEYLIKTGQTLAKGNYYYMTAPSFNAVSDDVVPGGFSVKDADGVISTIFFSKGNLYATHTTKTDINYWGFEANQYDYRTYGENSTISRNSPACINGSYGNTPYRNWGLFGWSTSDSNNKFGRTNTANPRYFRGDFIDWGKVFGDGSKWSTLTRDEWKWLIGPLTADVHNMECRESSTVNGVKNARWMRCKIKVTSSGTVYGVILFPDVFVWPTGGEAPLETTAVNVNANAGEYSKYSKAPTYTTTQFSTLELAGAVFLPAAGYREQSSIKGDATRAYYWTSTVGDDSSSSNPTSYAFTCWEDSGFGQTSMVRSLGCFVRLVRMAE